MVPSAAPAQQANGRPSALLVDAVLWSGCHATGHHEDANGHGDGERRLGRSDDVARRTARPTDRILVKHEHSKCHDECNGDHSAAHAVAYRPAVRNPETTSTTAGINSGNSKSTPCSSARARYRRTTSATERPSAPQGARAGHPRRTGRRTQLRRTNLQDRRRAAVVVDEREHHTTDDDRESSERSRQRVPNDRLGRAARPGPRGVVADGIAPTPTIVRTPTTCVNGRDCGPALDWVFDTLDGWAGDS